MAFNDLPLDQGLVGVNVSNLGLTKTAAMTLQVASGNVVTTEDGVTHTLTAAQSNVYSSDPTNPVQCFIGLIDDGVNVDIWFDAYVDDGLTERADKPAGYTRIITIGWMTIAPGETDLDNTTINRRTWV